MAEAAKISVGKLLGELAWLGFTIPNPVIPKQVYSESHYSECMYSLPLIPNRKIVVRNNGIRNSESLPANVS